MRILVAEDSVIAARVLERTLQKMGHDVTVVDNGATAWSLLQHHDFAIVISDWDMPHMDGLELCRSLRARHTPVYTYVILLTAKDQREDRLQGMRAGADDFLVKPLDPAELTARLEVAQRILAMQAQLANTIHHLEIANYRFSELYMGLPIACITYAPTGRIQEWNRACEAMFGVSADQALHRRFEDLICDASSDAPDRTQTLRVFGGETIRNVEWTYQHSDGRARHFLCNMFPMFGPDGAIMGAISAHVDITTRKEYEQQVARYSVALVGQKRELEEANAKLQALATTDGLTGLKNHRAFQERLALEMQRGTRTYTPLSVMMLDVDHFKKYNDAFGHPAGDQVLKSLGIVLQRNARVSDFVARYGGEEFVILLLETDSKAAAEVGERIREAVEGQVWEGRAVTVSIGIASVEGPGENVHLLVEQADRALYTSKSLGRNRVTCYSERLRQSTQNDPRASRESTVLSA